MRVELVDTMGTDLSVVNAARVSMDKESDYDYEEIQISSGDYEYLYRLKEADVKLIRYLAKHNHFTPFTHCMITVRETVPIFVARQRFKHTVGFTYNEVSRRYVDDTPEFYTPDVWRKRAENVKQGSSDEIVEVLPNLEWNGYSFIKNDYESFINSAKAFYEALIEGGVAPEQARMVLPQSMYTSYYCTGSLHAFARAYLLRSDPHAQQEIQVLAKEWDKILQNLYPVSWKELTYVRD